MGWAVGWDARLQRFRGYGVPAFCDVKDCRNEIDRGLGYIAEPGGVGDGDDDFDDTADGAVFTCHEHGYEDVHPGDRSPEHPDWIAHVSADDTWGKWRDENPEILARMTT